MIRCIENCLRRGIFTAVQQHLISQGDVAASCEKDGDQDCQGYTMWRTPAIQHFLMQGGVSRKELQDAGILTSTLEQVAQDAVALGTDFEPVHALQTMKLLGQISNEELASRWAEEFPEVVVVR